MSQIETRLDRDTALVLEHLTSAEKYALAADHVRAVAEDVGVTLR